jgi:molybdate transport system substrate-binding protein
MVPPDGDGQWLALLLSGTMALGCDQAPPSAAHGTAAGGALPTTTAPVQVAAASDLTLAFEELGALFEARTAQKVTFSFAASGALAKQLSQGAPFDLFAAANASFVDSAVNAGACDGATKALYARGHLVAWSKAGGPRLASLAELREPHIKRIAIANPEHAPYGKAAREALTRAGIWADVQPKIVLAENVRQALQLAQTGNVEVALIALSLVAKDASGTKLRVDPQLYGPIDQTLVVCRHGRNAAGARAFAQLVASAEGQALLERYGFAGSTKQAAK